MMEILRKRVPLSTFGTFIKSPKTCARSSFSTWPVKINRNSSVPFVEHFRPVWPERPMLPTKELEILIPKRTVPDSALTFKLRATFDHGTAIHYPHLQHNPADFKVVMWVKFKDLGLSSKRESRILQEMVGPRFKHSHDGGILTLTCERFPNRTENKKYLIYQLESLLVETREIYARHRASMKSDEVSVVDASSQL